MLNHQSCFHAGGSDGPDNGGFDFGRGHKFQNSQGSASHCRARQCCAGERCRQSNRRRLDGVGGHDDDETVRAGCDAAFGEEFAQAFDGAADAFLRRVFTRAQSGADVAQIPAFIKPEHDGLAILLAQAPHRGIQQRSDLPPDVVP